MTSPVDTPVEYFTSDTQLHSDPRRDALIAQGFKPAAVDLAIAATEIYQATARADIGEEFFRALHALHALEA